MKLLGLEATQVNTYFLSRYRQVEDLGVELFILNGEGANDYWPAQRYRVAGSKRIDDIVEFARFWHDAERFDGVFTFSESAVVAVAKVADALGLPGIGIEAARTSRNKLLMRQAHERAGVPHPPFRFVPDLPAALAAADEFGYPVILKPTLGSGSNFVFRIDRPEELRLRFPQAADGIGRMLWFRMEADGVDLGPHGLMIESFLDGREYLIETLAWDDEVYLGSVVDRVTVEGDTFDDDVHHAPTALRPDQLKDVHRVVRAATRAQGVHRGVLHAEIRFHQGKPYPLEIAVRPGGGGLDYVARLSAGYDPIRALMDVSRGARPNAGHYRPTDVHTAAMCLICGAGRLEAIDIPASVTDSDKVFFLKITAKPDDLIRRPPDGNTILGFLGTTGTSFEDAMSTATELAKRIEVKLALAESAKAAIGEPPSRSVGAAPLSSIPEAHVGSAAS
jgi:hypothetical protein